MTADLGIIGVVPADLGEAYINQHIALVRPSEEVVGRWLGRLLALGPSARAFRLLDETGAKAGLNLPALESVIVAVPSREEQIASNTVLDAVDEEIRAQRAASAKLGEIKAGLASDLLTGRVRVPESLFAPEAPV